MESDNFRPFHRGRGRGRGVVIDSERNNQRGRGNRKGRGRGNQGVAFADNVIHHNQSITNQRFPLEAPNVPQYHQDERQKNLRSQPIPLMSQECINPNTNHHLQYSHPIGRGYPPNAPAINRTPVQPAPYFNHPPPHFNHPPPYFSHPRPYFQPNAESQLLNRPRSRNAELYSATSLTGYFPPQHLQNKSRLQEPNPYKNCPNPSSEEGSSNHNRNRSRKQTNKNSFLIRKEKNPHSQSLYGSNTSLNSDGHGKTNFFHQRGGSHKRGVQNQSHSAHSSSLSLNLDFQDQTTSGNYETMEREMVNEKESVEITIQHLESLLKMDPDTITELLLEKNNTYLSIIEEEASPKLFMLFVDILSKVCRAASSRKGGLLRQAILPTFLDRIFVFVEDLPYIEDHSNIQYEPLFINLITIYDTFIQFMPSHSQIWHNHLLNAKKSLTSTEKNLNLKLNQNLFSTVDSMLADILDVPLDEIAAPIHGVRNTKSKLKKASYYPEPVGDFRTVSVLPRPEDIYDEQPFLNPNVIDGPYSSIDQYLDTHFKLLREDFVSPIRKAIKDYRKQVNSKEKFKRIENVRIYRRVKFLHSKTVFDKVGYEVCFDVDNRINHVNWEFSNRFMFGSLLLFSNDNFDSFFLGTVANKNVKELENKLLMVELKDAHEAKSILGKEFVMAESEAYFEPYFHVLSALQRFNDTNFPLAKYIVKAETETDPPVYLNPMEFFTINTNGRSFTFRALSDVEWPSSNDLGLDISQFEAYKAALTNDLVVIQGPPGTGKTFLGLKIAQGLLQNCRVWNPSQCCPIFVVCFTNHALDQFLEGLLPVTNKLVRIGGKSKGAELDKFNIKERRREYGYYKKRANFAETRRKQLEMSTLFAKMKQCQTDIQKLEDGEGILSLNTLKLVMNNVQSEFFNSDDQVLDWLLRGIRRNEIDSKVKVTITADGVIREPIRDSFQADSEDERLKQAFFDAVDIEEVSLKEDEKLVHFAMNLKQIQQQQLQEQQQSKKKNKQKTTNQQNSDLGFVLKHLKSELIDCKKVPSELEKMNLLGEIHLNNLHPDDRWKLYNTWLDTLKTGLIAELGKIEKEFKDCAYCYEQLRQHDDLQILKSADVVGTTTTIAARLQPLFELLAPKIVIVEEAAEVLEAHIIASLTQNCQQLILIGDHKQLRPNIAEMRMGRQFFLDVSLFERMVKNGMACHTLNLQHRMRPEISQQLVPTIYPTLQDDISVFDREPIKGMKKNCFFMTHNQFEDEVVEITSKRNRFEAEVLLMLAKYLVQQGYNPQDITILATYKGQMYHMKNEIKRLSDFPKGIQITVVDNFQGEENKIILLSLVRSNKMNKIGFLEIENRVCVALSRARDGLYIVGNMDNLVANSEIWPHIKISLQRQQAIGPCIELQCQIHRDQVTRVSSGGDFCKVAEGGCTLVCNQELSCGHNCKSMCHINQDYHKILKCKDPCRKACNYGHPCLKKCHQSCEECKVPRRQILLCGHSAEIPCYMDSRLFKCMEIVEVEIPDCGHRVRVSCHSRRSPKCDVPCFYRPDCGHRCTRVCHVNDDSDHIHYECTRPCARLNKGCSKDHHCKLKCNEPCKPCVEVVEKQLNCGHSVKLPCGIPLSTIQCRYKCTRTLACGHQCPKWCKEPCDPCMQMVEKVVNDCQHKVKVACSTTAQIWDCDGPCIRYLKCGHQCTQKCWDPCSSQDCTVPIPFKTNNLMPCGHFKVNIPCNESAKFKSVNVEELMQFCAEPCGKVLSCKHQCTGTCSECLQGRIHKICEQPCGNVLICGHSCPVPCREVCPPCNKPCSYKCKHSQCPKKCGEVCTPCNEPCEYNCEHTKCSRLCWEMCDREPCYEQCRKLFECGHACVGFCGEPCPPCRTCHPQYYEEFFGTGEETEDDALWILLEDCNHVFESTCLEYWLNIQQDGKEIVNKACPRCKTQIITVQRYMNVIKSTFKDIEIVKSKSYGQLDEIRKLRQSCVEKFNSITFEPLDSATEPFELNKLHSTISNGLAEEKVRGRNVKRNRVNAQKSQLLAFLTEFFFSMYCRYQEVKDKLNEEAKATASYQMNFLVRLLMKRTLKINKDEMESFERELRRLHRLLDLLVYTSSEEFQAAVSCSPNSLCFHYRKLIETHLNLVMIYDDRLDKKIVELLHILQKEIKSSTEISPAERAMINKAMSQDFHSSQKTGHWFKCKNNHIYCITECGGAMQVAQCPVPGCGEIIGGQNHALRPDQSLATEMDGARYAAWSDLNNMANFRNVDN